MRAMLRAASAVLLLLLPAALLLANPAVWPKQDAAPKTATLPLTVHAEPLTKTTTLSLPGATVKQLRAELPPDKDGDTGRAGLPVLHTLVAGVALSAALVLGGLWLARGGRKRALAGVACLLGAVVVVGLSCGPSHNVIREDGGTVTELDPPTIQADGTLDGRCLLQRGTGDEVVLSINREALTKLAQQAPKEEGR